MKRTELVQVCQWAKDASLFFLANEFLYVTRNDIHCVII